MSNTIVTSSSAFTTMKPAAIRYVSIIAVDPHNDEVLLVRKTKGPAHIRNKITFPGGKIESDDPSAAHAAARELLEESGVEVPPFDLIHLAKTGNPEQTLEVFVAITSLSEAGPQASEEEPVFKASLSETRQAALNGNPDYVSDTSALLESMHSVRQIHRRLSLASSRSASLNKKSPSP